MDNRKMAEFIAEQRKLKRMTQKDLAERLGITDKAVSKWERGLSCPDISLLTELSDVLEVSVSELLSGSKAGSSEDTDLKTIVEDTLQYANTVTKSRSKDIRLILIVTISALSFLGITICMICDFAITGRLTWSLFPVSSLVYAWLIITSSIIYSRKGVLVALILISLLTIPFLFVLEKIIGINGLIMPLATPVFIITMLYLWMVYLMIGRTKYPKYITVALSFLAGIPLSFGINYIVSMRTGDAIIDIWDIPAYVVLFILSGLIYGYGYIRNRSIR